MTRGLDARVSKLERQSRSRGLASLSDAELAAMIVDMGDLLAAHKDDPEVTHLLRAGASADGLTEDEVSSMVEAWRAWCPNLLANH